MDQNKKYSNESSSTRVEVSIEIMMVKTKAAVTENHEFQFCMKFY